MIYPMFPKYCSRKNATNPSKTKMILKYDCRFKFIFNSAFNEKKIKITFLTICLISN